MTNIPVIIGHAYLQDLLSCARIPDAGGVVKRCGDNLHAIGAKYSASNNPSMTFHHREQVTGGRVENARKAATAPQHAAAAGDGEKPTPRTRENSKQAQVIAMLKRPEGATIKQVCEATEWQAHTVRGTFAGAFKKKLGLTITSEKTEGGERIYRLCSEPHKR